jgi:hypothetical protein
MREKSRKQQLKKSEQTRALKRLFKTGVRNRRLLTLCAELSTARNRSRQLYKEGAYLGLVVANGA